MKIMQDSYETEQNDVRLENNVAIDSQVVDVNGDGNVVDVTNGTDGTFEASGDAMEDTAQTVQRDSTQPVYQNVFAKLMGKVASIFPEGNRFHDIFTGMAENLDASLGHVASVPMEFDTMGKEIPAGVGAGVAGAFGTAIENGVRDVARAGGTVKDEKLSPKTEDTSAAKESQADAAVKDVQADAAKDVPEASHFVDLTRAGELTDVMNGMNNEANGKRMAKGGAFLEYFSQAGLEKVGEVSGKGGQAMSQEVLSQLERDPDNAEAGKQFSGNYVSIFEGMQSFQTEAVREIEGTYEGEEKTQAMEHLGEYMNQMVTPFYDSLREADHGAQMPFLTDEDRKKIDGMEFLGMEQTYSEHEFSKDMDEDAFGMSDFEEQLGSMDLEDGAFVNPRDAATWDSKTAGNAIDKQAFAKSASIFSKEHANEPAKKRDYGKLASERLGGLVKNDTDKSMDVGMEL